MVSQLTQLLRTARPYLLTVVAAVVAAKFAQYLWQYVWPAIPLIKGQAPGIYVMFIGLGVAAAFWLYCRSARTRDTAVIVLLGLLALTWLVHAGIGKVHGDPTPYTVLLTPVVLAALWLKTPEEPDVKAGIVFLGGLLAVLLVVTRALEMLGIIPMVDVGAWLLRYEQGHYWLPLAGWLGPDGRWPGPMGHNAQTGNVAALILVLGIGLRSRWRWLLVAVGALTLLLTSSKTSYLAAVVGVVLVLLLGENPLTRRVRRRWLFMGLGLGGAAVIALVLIQNPNLTGRTDYWASAVDAWSRSPIIGVGGSALASPELEQLGSNAHNIFIDAALKYGVIGLLPVVALAAYVITLAIRAATFKRILPLALLATYLVIGFAEADQSWLGPGVMWLWFILPAIWAALVHNGSVELEPEQLTEPEAQVSE